MQFYIFKDGLTNNFELVIGKYSPMLKCGVCKIDWIGFNSTILIILYAFFNIFLARFVIFAITLVNIVGA